MRIEVGVDDGARLAELEKREFIIFLLFKVAFDEDLVKLEEPLC